MLIQCILQLTLATFQLQGLQLNRLFVINFTYRPVSVHREISRKDFKVIHISMHRMEKQSNITLP